MKSFVSSKVLSILLVIMIAMVALVPMMTRAATTSQVVVTVHPLFISISNSPSIYEFSGFVGENTTPTTTANYFTIANYSSVAIDISIAATNFTGGIGWTLASNATPGSMIAGMYAGIVSGTFDTVIKTSPGNALKTNLAASENQTWHLQLMAPIVYADGVTKESTITVSAAATT